MAYDMVMRSFYLRPEDDTELRQLAHERAVSKNDLIRSAITTKLREWREDEEALNRDLRLGRRDREVSRSRPARAVRVDRPPRASVGSAAADPDILDLLAEDHRRIEELFERFEEARGDGRAEKIGRRICAELKVHMLIEEEVFYPALRGQVDDDDLDEALVEHDGLKVLVNEIEAGGPDEDFYEAKVRVLQEHFEHHVDEEEKGLGNVFDEARKSGVDLTALGGMARGMKQLLLEEARDAAAIGQEAGPSELEKQWYGR